jgi:hypothetical protein
MVLSVLTALPRGKVMLKKLFSNEKMNVKVRLLIGACDFGAIVAIAVAVNVPNQCAYKRHLPREFSKWRTFRGVNASRKSAG